MSTMTLEQNRLAEQRKLILHADRVELLVCQRKTKSTTFFRYEDITNGKTFLRQKSQPNYGLYVIARNCSIFLLFASVFGAVESWAWFFAALTSSIVFFCIHAFSFRSLIELDVDGQHRLALFKDEPTEEAASLFLEELYARRNEYLRKQYYLSCDGTTEHGQVMLGWLLYLDAITQPEYDLKMKGVYPRDWSLN